MFLFSLYNIICQKEKYRLNLMQRQKNQKNARHWFKDLGTTSEEKIHKMLVCQATKHRNAAITLLEMKK